MKLRSMLTLNISLLIFGINLSTMLCLLYITMSKDYSVLGNNVEFLLFLIGFYIAMSTILVLYSRIYRVELPYWFVLLSRVSNVFLVGGMSLLCYKVYLLETWSLGKISLGMLGLVVVRIWTLEEKNKIIDLIWDDQNNKLLHELAMVYKKSLPKSELTSSTREMLLSLEDPQEIKATILKIFAKLRLAKIEELKNSESWWGTVYNFISSPLVLGVMLGTGIYIFVSWYNSDLKNEESVSHLNHVLNSSRAQSQLDSELLDKIISATNFVNNFLLSEPMKTELNTLCNAGKYFKEEFSMKSFINYIANEAIKEIDPKTSSGSAPMIRFPGKGKKLGSKSTSDIE